MSSENPRHPINYVARRCGLTTHAIRVWERRYGAVTPLRTESNRRLYSDADIERLQLLKTITAAGHSICHIAQIPSAELRALAESLKRTIEPANDAGRRTINAAEFVPANIARCRTAVLAMDTCALEDALLDATVHLTQFEVIDDVIAPLMRWVGDEWFAGRLRVAHEHLAAATVRRFIVQLRTTHGDTSAGPAIVIATPSGQLHEVGAQLAACVAAMDGWRDAYFGTNLPVAEIAQAVNGTHARAVGLSICYLADRATLVGEVTDLRRLIGDGVELVVGGRVVRHYRAGFENAGARCVDSLGEFRQLLQTFAAVGV